jgi:hypothetical protein
LAQELELDSKALLCEYDARQSVMQVEDAHRESPAFRQSIYQYCFEWRKQILVAAGIIAFLIMMVLVIIYYSGRKPGSGISDSRVILSNASASQEESPASSTGGGFIVQALGLADVWIEIGIDSGVVEYVYLLQGEKKEWNVSHSMFVGLTDARRIRLLLNGLPLDLAADSAASVNLWIDEEGIARRMPRETKSDENAVNVSKTVDPTAMIGVINEMRLFENFPDYVKRRDAYQPNSTVVSQIEALNPSLSIVCFMATWDSLSLEVVPELLRIFESTTLPRLSYSLIGVDADLKDKAGLVEFHKVENVPTILFLSRGYELDRIVGQPQQRIEHRFLDIVEKSQKVTEE